MHRNGRFGERTDRGRGPLATAIEEATDPSPAEGCCAGDTGDESFRWRSALIQVVGFNTAQHLFRLREPKTRNELGGPFLTDWFESVGSLGGNWNDLGKTFTNYVAHPMGGAVYANIYRQNDPGSVDLELGDTQYGGMLLKAMLFSAAVSTQFELGPFSEASIGNVGLNDNRKMGWVDLLVTPTLGAAWMAGEDVIDKFVLKRIDGRSIGFRSVARVLLNPSRSAANLSRGKLALVSQSRSCGPRHLGTPPPPITAPRSRSARASRQLRRFCQSVTESPSVGTESRPAVDPIDSLHRLSLVFPQPRLPAPWSPVSLFISMKNQASVEGKEGYNPHTAWLEFAGCQLLSCGGGRVFSVA